MQPAALPARTTDRPVAVRETRDSDRSVSKDDANIARRHEQGPNGTVAAASRYDITLAEFRRHLQDHTAVIIDARPPDDFSRGHARGALNLPAGQEDAYIGDIRRDVATSQLIVIYCNGPHCPAADAVFDYAVSYGFNNMRVFKPGWQTLKSAKDIQ
ncbi:MAG TPA: rhodanese-like domain-containing protein [Phycisphaerae bacterium]